MSPDGNAAPPSVVVIGVGNAQRGDDAVGHVVVRQLALTLADQQAVRCVLESGEGTCLMAAWQGVEAAMLIDAAQSGSRPGTVHRLDAVTQPMPHAWWRCSTHAFGVAQAIELARVLGELPPRLLVYAIEGASFDAGAPLSSAVEGVVADVVAQIQHDLRTLAAVSA